MNVKLQNSYKVIDKCGASQIYCLLKQKTRHKPGFFMEIFPLGNLFAFTNLLDNT